MDEEIAEFISGLYSGQLSTLQASSLPEGVGTVVLSSAGSSGGENESHGNLANTITMSITSSDIINSVNNIATKVDSFEPFYEVILKDSKKLATQIESCRETSDRMSSIVRRLDNMQYSASQALQCVEDMIGLKDCKVKIARAIEENNLPLAVSIIKKVHDTDTETALASEDYEAIRQYETELRILVKKEFVNSIEENNIKSVMSLCPLLQTLALESEGRDIFIDFVERTVFAGVSADSVEAVTDTDAATGYAQALSNIFNSSYLILQQYLPIVLQGMESSQGDVFFIRRLHAKCERESGVILKRYLKYRNIKDAIPSSANGYTSSLASSSKGSSNNQLTSELHVILDELAILIQYCCSYSKYIKQLCAGAENRARAGSRSAPQSPTAPSTAQVFSAPTDFDKMVDELINRYYMEGETFLLKEGVKVALPSSYYSSPAAEDSGGVGVQEQISSGLDECFFVMQRCAQRAIATNNIHAASAVLHTIYDLLSSDLAGKAAELLRGAANKICVALMEAMSRYTRDDADGATGNSLAKGLKSAMSLVGVSSSGSSGSGGKSEEDTDDPFGLAQHMHVVNLVETCCRYIDRLTKDITAAGNSVFIARNAANDSSADSGQSSADKVTQRRAPAQTETNRLRQCKEDFDAARLLFSNVLKNGLEGVLRTSNKIIKDLLPYSFSAASASPGGLRFDLPDDAFRQQPALPLYPKLVVAALESMLGVLTTNLSETNKDFMVGLLADVLSERLEHFISQTTFRFAGALKFEEIARALTTLLSRSSQQPIRNKFSRLREVLLVLTSEGGGGGDYNLLTVSEVAAVAGLRLDLAPGSVRASGAR